MGALFPHRSVPIVIVLALGHTVPADAQGDLAPLRWSHHEKASAIERAGVALYIVGGLYDLYTTKRGLDASLHEANPLLSDRSDARRTLLRAAVAKVGLGILIGKTGRSERSRARWFFTCGGVQLGAGLANRRTIRRELAGEPGPSLAIAAPLGPAPPGSISRSGLARKLVVVDWARAIDWRAGS